MEERRSCAANLLSQDVAPHNGRSSASQFAAASTVPSPDLGDQLNGKCGCHVARETLGSVNCTTIISPSSSQPVFMCHPLMSATVKRSDIVTEAGSFFLNPSCPV
jgi:hypothetical protein